MNTSILEVIANHGISHQRKMAALVFAWAIDSLRLLGGGVFDFDDHHDDLADIFAAIILVWIVGIDGTWL